MTPRLWVLIVVCAPWAAVARADGLDVQLRLDDGRVGVRLAGSSECDDGDLWGAVELGRECRGELGWDVPVRGRYGDSRDEWRDGGFPVRLRGDWRDRGSRGDWDARYYGDSRTGSRFGGRIHFVPRESAYGRWDQRDPWWRGDPRDDEWRDVYIPGRRDRRDPRDYPDARGRYGEDWRDVAPPRSRAGRDDERDSRARDEGGGGDEWRDVYVPGPSSRR